ncbi:MAG: ABC transporter permease [Saccharofermentanales bacterium]
MSLDLIEIILITLAVCSASTFLGSVLGIPAGILLGMRRGDTWKLGRMLCMTMVGLPPVLAGLVVYMMLRNGGLFSGMQILFTPAAIVFAQVLIIFPIVTAGVFPSVSQKRIDITETLNGLNIHGMRRFIILLRENRPALVTSILLGFGRAISEVGAVMIVGGNILHKTRVMTTAIVLETGKGNFGQAFSLGVMLLIISFTVNFFARRMANDHV